MVCRAEELVCLPGEIDVECRSQGGCGVCVQEVEEPRVLRELSVLIWARRCLPVIAGDDVRQGDVVVVEEPRRGPPQAMYAVDEQALAYDGTNELDRKRPVVGICAHDTV